MLIFYKAVKKNRKERRQETDGDKKCLLRAVLGKCVCNVKQYDAEEFDDAEYNVSSKWEHALPP